MRNHILCLAIGLATGLIPATAHAQKGAMTTHASGTFDVKLAPQKDEGIGDPTIGRMAIDKQYHGDLEGTGLGQMLAGMAAAGKESRAYLAIEPGRGTPRGRPRRLALPPPGAMTPRPPPPGVTRVSGS